MKTPKEKIRKLKKSRLGPSIALFLFSLVLGGFLLYLEFWLYATYVVEAKFVQSFLETKGIVQGMETLLFCGEDMETIVKQTSQHLGMDRPIAMLDEQGNVLVSEGRLTADFTRKGIFDDWEDREIFLDLEEESGEVWKNEGAVQYVDPTRVLVAIITSQMQSLGDVILTTIDGEMSDVVSRFVFWQKLPFAEGKTSVLIKCTLAIRKDDLMYGYAITLISSLLFFLILSLQFANVVSNIHSHQRMEKLLLLDFVTGGDNWISFVQKGSKILEKKKNSGKTKAIVQFSVMKYQSYCALFGTKAGEEMLENLSGKLTSFLHKGEVCGHVGGADFAMLLLASSGESGRNEIENRIKELFAKLASGGGTEKNRTIDFSVFDFHAGIRFVENEDYKKAPKRVLRQADIDELYVNAGIAKSSVEQEEGSVFACFSEKMWEEQLWEHKVENTMQAAMDNEEFEVYVQPKYNPSTDRLQGAEALVRWNSPVEGMISPGRFVPIFEKTGFVTKLDDYMISHVAKLQSQWIAEGKQVVPISVNVSRAHFAQPDLAEHIRDLVDAWKVPHEYVEIELTESAFFDDKKALLTTVHKLQEYGFDVSMDDFGSGYSSLNSLKDLPLNVLKLDAEFFRGEEFGTRGEIVVSKAIALAKQLNMKIVAEGVEKKEQVDFLAKQECDMIQGYYYAKPMPAAEYAQRLEDAGKN